MHAYCACVCALLRGLCVRGAEHLNINNCHAGHLGPHSQLAPRAHSHHQHSCHGERGWGVCGGDRAVRRGWEWETSGREKKKKGERKKTQQKQRLCDVGELRLCKLATVPKCRNEQGESFACAALQRDSLRRVAFQLNRPAFCPRQRDGAS